MRRKLQAFVLPLLICLGVAFAAALVGSEWTDRTDRSLVSYVLPNRAEPEPVAEPVEEAIPLELLPETGWAWHLSLFLHDDWQSRADEVAIVRAFTTDARLAKLKKQVHHHVYTPSNPLFPARYAKSIRSLPAVRLQEADGRVIYQVGNSIPVPQTARGLGNEIAKAINERCPFPRPRPKPEPEPGPSPNPTPIPDMPVPDVSPNVEPDDEAADEDEDFPLLPVCCVLGLLSAAGAAYLAARKDALGNK